jgi:hypothetical protein
MTSRLSSMNVAKRLLYQFLGTAVLFSATVALRTSFILLVASAIGYLPYSDRPGPGWWGRVHLPSLGEIGNYLGFAPWFAYFCLFFGVGLFLLSLVFGFASTPKWLNRLVGGVIAALAAGLAVDGAGSYFALAAIGPDTAIVLGLFYGAFLFPRFVVSRERRLSLWLRVAAVAVASCLFIFWIASPFLPRKPVPQITLELNRITPGEKTYSVSDTRFLGADISKEVEGLGLMGEGHGGISQSGGGNSTLQTNVLLIALEPIDREYKLSLPKTGYVVYVLKDHHWIAHPEFNETDGRKLLILPGSDSTYDGGQIKLGNAKSFSSFTWYPAILKTR